MKSVHCALRCGMLVMVYGKFMLRRICGSKRERERERGVGAQNGIKCKMQSFVSCILLHLKLGCDVRRSCGWMSEMRNESWLTWPKGRTHQGDQGLDGRVILRWMLKKWISRIWTGFNLFKMWTSGRPFWTWIWNFGFKSGEFSN